MSCACVYCIYNQEYQCILGEVDLDATGTCLECELISVALKLKERQRRERLKQITPRESGR